MDNILDIIKYFLATLLIVGFFSSLQLNTRVAMKKNKKKIGKKERELEKARRWNKSTARKSLYKQEENRQEKRPLIQKSGEKYSQSYFLNSEENIQKRRDKMERKNTTNMISSQRRRNLEKEAKSIADLKERTIREDIIKGIVFSELISKPKALRKDN